MSLTQCKDDLAILISAAPWRCLSERLSLLVWLKHSSLLYVRYPSIWKFKYLTVFLSACLSAYLPSDFKYLPIYLPTNPSIHPSIHQSIYSFIHPSACLLTVCLYINIIVYFTIMFCVDKRRQSWFALSLTRVTDQICAHWLNHAMQTGDPGTSCLPRAFSPSNFPVVIKFLNLFLPWHV